jgi:cytochrome c5
MIRIIVSRLVRVAALTAVLVFTGCGDGATGGAAGESAAAHPGEQTYNRFCFSCHQGGIAGAPRFGDAEAWAPRIAKGSELLLANTKTGITPGMPAMGLCNSCTEQDLIDVIDFMVQAATPVSGPQ